MLNTILNSITNKLNTLQGVILLLIGLNLLVSIGCKQNSESLKIGSDKTVVLDKTYLGKRLEGEMDGKGQHLYQISLTNNECLAFNLEQNGIDVAIEVLSPKNESLLKYDNQPGIKGNEPFVFVSEQTGKHTIKIVPVNSTAIAGKYSFVFYGLRSINEIDNVKVEGIKLLSTGKEKIYKQAEEVSKGVEEVKVAVGKFHQIDDKWHLCVSLNIIGNGCYILGKIDEAEKSYNEAMSIYISSKLMDKHLQSNLLDSIGLIASTKGNFQDSITAHTKSLDIVTELGDSLKRAYLLNNLANCFGELGDLEKAISYLVEAIALQEKYGSLDEVYIAKINLANMYTRLGNDEKSISSLVSCLDLTKPTNFRVTGYVKHCLSVNYLNLGDNDSSQMYAEQAIDDFKRCGSLDGQGQCFGQMGLIYSIKGDNQKALKYYELSLSNILDISYHANVFTKIGYVHNQLNNTRESLNYFMKSLDLCNKQNIPYEKLLALVGIGKTEMGLGKYRSAYSHLEESLKISNSLKINVFEPEILFCLAKIAFNRNNVVLAEEKIKESIEVYELIRSEFITQDAKLFISSKVNEYYDLYIEILMNKYKKTKDSIYLETAWQYLEKSRSRMLSELIKQSNLPISNLDSDLLKRQLVLQRKIARNTKERIDLFSKAYTQQQLDKLEKDFLELKLQHQALEVEIKKNNPQKIDLNNNDIKLTISEVQKDLLDDSSTILEYQFGISKNYVFVINKDNFTVIELSNQQIEKIREFIGSLSIFTSPSKDERFLEQRKFLYLKQASFLYKALIGLIDQKLLKARLIIVNDGVLNQLAWAVLVNNENQPLLTKHEIVTVPSITSLILGRQSKKLQSELGLVICDPVFDSADERISKSRSDIIVKSGNSVYTSIIQASIKELGLRNGFSRLLFTQTEANNIKSLKPETKIVSGFDANLEKLNSLPAKRYQFIHFATHGFINNRDPNLSSIVLSLYDQNGRAVDGYLTIAEINRLKISADLVVMSACQSGIGQLLNGEGSIGLGWAFMSNGSPRLVTTLWNINDEFTSVLMNRFYQKMLVGKLPAVRALRESQMEIMKEEKWEDPYYWGAFTFQGDWN